MAGYRRAKANLDIRALIQKADDLFFRHGRDIRAEAPISQALDAYAQAIAQTGNMDQDLGLPVYCAACGARDEVCCFDGVQERYDETLLLINLLLGVRIPREREIDDSCFFCSLKGCRLIAKHSFCLNFNCAEVKKGLGPEAMGRLNRQVGLELQSQWELERLLAPWLWKRE